MPARKERPTLVEIYAGTVENDGGCWEWQRARTRNGYGRLRFGGKHYTTHRLAYELKHGEIPDGLWVLHSCDNPPCCNPAHLRVGTVGDNVADMVSRGRAKSAGLPGERNPKAKLTATQVAEIRASSGPARLVAPKYGVSASLVHQIRRGDLWRETGAVQLVSPLLFLVVLMSLLVLAFIAGETRRCAHLESTGDPQFARYCTTEVLR